MTQQHSNQDDLDQLCVNTIRFLAVDAVEKAKSGHPGAPMGLAPIAYVLWTRHLRFDPKDPNWFNRDRFMLSNGHASLLHYALLHLTGYDLSLDDLKQFRQFGSKTPGHPERGDTPGIEVTTGPLGQGFANAVGMAVAEQFLASTFNQGPQAGSTAPRGESGIIDHHTYVIMGDGCMEEGITSEAASLAGHLQLGKLIAFYDSNRITIDGDTNITFTEDVNKRFEAYHWHVLDVADPNDLDAIDHAIHVAKSVLDKPSLIVCHTHIGYGSPNKQDSAKAHGNPLGKDEIVLTKKHLGWPLEDFLVPPEAEKVFHEAGERGIDAHKKWDEAFAEYKKEFREEGKSLSNAIERILPDGWDDALPIYKESEGPVATRTIGGKVMNMIAERVPTLMSGSADLNESTFTKLEKYDDFEPSQLKHGTYSGRTINFGIREHTMAAMINGMAAHGGVYPSGSTFFVFSDYMRPAVRLSAIMQVPSVFVWTHDSVAVGEDGPTHEPIEHLMSLRAMPGFTIIRPADANETVEAWRCIMKMKGPAGIALTRQKLPVIDQEKYAKASGLSKGAYIISDAMSAPEIILIATGSEVQLALGAQIDLEKKGLMTRVVSMPCWKFFEEQPEHYRNMVLPPEVTCRLSIELGCSFGWEKWVGANGASLAIDHFGASAPYEKLMDAFGFSVANVVHIAELLLKQPEAAREELRNLQKRHTH